MRVLLIPYRHRRHQHVRIGGARRSFTTTLPVIVLPKRFNSAAYR